MQEMRSWCAAKQDGIRGATEKNPQHSYMPAQIPVCPNCPINSNRQVSSIQGLSCVETRKRSHPRQGWWRCFLKGIQISCGKPTLRKSELDAYSQDTPEIVVALEDREQGPGAVTSWSTILKRLAIYGYEGPSECYVSKPYKKIFDFLCVFYRFTPTDFKRGTRWIVG